MKIDAFIANKIEAMTDEQFHAFYQRVSGIAKEVLSQAYSFRVAKIHDREVNAELRKHLKP